MLDKEMSIEQLIKDLRNIKRIQKKLVEHDDKFKMECHQKHVIELDEAHEAGEVELKLNEPQVPKNIFKDSEEEGITFPDRNIKKDPEKEQANF